MIDCVQLARQYLSFQIGSADVALRGVLPTAESRDEQQRGQELAKLLFALHLLREEEKLDIASEEVCNTVSGSLGPVLAQIGHWMGWDSWSGKPGAFFSLEDPVMGQYLFDDCKSNCFALLIFAWLHVLFEALTLECHCAIYEIGYLAYSILRQHIISATQAAALFEKFMSPRFCDSRSPHCHTNIL